MWIVGFKGKSIWIGGRMRKWEVEQIDPSVSDVACVVVTTPDAWRVADVWTTQADAELIAAAPELLWRLKQVLSHMGRPQTIALALAVEGAKELIQRLEGE